jgi:hypothetical protein
LSGTGSLVLSASTQDVTSKTVICDKSQYHYLLYAPLRSGALPAIVILHGAGDQPDPMLEAWKFLAQKEGHHPNRTRSSAGSGI